MYRFTQNKHAMITGWGRYPRAVCYLFRPERVREVAEALQYGGMSSYLPRGLGRAYGDAALNSEQGVLLMERLDRYLDFDKETGLLRCEGGVALADIIATFLPRGWFLPVTPAPSSAQSARVWRAMFMEKTTTTMAPSATSCVH
jgi:FAD/FMN-containing dehydrogenase